MQIPAVNYFELSTAGASTINPIDINGNQLRQQTIVCSLVNGSIVLTLPSIASLNPNLDYTLTITNEKSLGVLIPPGANLRIFPAEDETIGPNESISSFTSFDNFVFKPAINNSWSVVSTQLPPEEPEA